MKKTLISISLLVVFSLLVFSAGAQCSICSKTAMQMGSKPAQGLNTGIIYLMAIPYLVVSVVAFKWWKNEKNKAAADSAQQQGE